MDKRLTHSIFEYKQVGVLRRAHGKDGALRCTFDEVFFEDLSVSAFVFIELEGNKVPHKIEELYGGPDYFIQLEGVNSPEEAAHLAGRTIFLPLIDISISDEEISKIEKHPLLNYTVINNDVDVIGQISEVEQYPQQEMAIIQFRNQPLLIPLHEDLITSIDKENLKLFMTLPEGLLDLTHDLESE